MAPAAKAFGVFVGLMGLHEALEAGAGQVFQKLLETVYPEHVAAQGLELTLGLVVHGRLYCTPRALDGGNCSGQVVGFRRSDGL